MKKVSKIYFILNFLFSLNLFAQSTDVFTSTGTTTWTVPPCVTTITVQDVYIWKINARDIFNIDHFLTGHVTLIKKDN